MHATTVEKTIRLGAGSAYENDHPDAPQLLSESGQVDYIIFDCLSEKTNLEGALRMAHGDIGYDVFLERKLRTCLPGCVKHGTRLITNGGVADVEGAARMVERVCHDIGITGLRVGYVLGHDVLDTVKAMDPLVSETGRPASQLGDRLVAAHVYQGARQIVEALQRGANVVLTGRAGDSAQYLAPMIHEFGWSFDDWNRIGKGLGIGHLLECGGQVSGGFFADPGHKMAPDLDRLGFPIAEVRSNGDAVITKLPGTGGIVSELTVKEQMVYEVHDPRNYMHTDGVVDFTTSQVRHLGPDRVSVTGTTGHPRPANAKVVLGVVEGFVGMGRVVYGGTGAYARAQLGAEIVCKRLISLYGFAPEDIRVDFIGANALFNWDVDPSSLMEVELRVAVRCPTRHMANQAFYTVSELPCNGPASPAWGRPVDQGGVEEVIGLYTTLMPQDLFNFEVHDFVVK